MQLIACYLYKSYLNISINFYSIKRLSFAHYTYFTATHHRNITNETSRTILNTVHYESLNSDSNCVHLRLIDYLNFLCLLHITIAVTID